MALIETIGIKNVIIYVVVINIIAFLAMGLDKWKAKRNAWRIPEQTLISLVLLGGGIGGIVGMYLFRHKTKKARFYIGFPALFIVEVIIFIYIIIKF